MSFPPDLTQFVEGQEWIFAKTYAKTWPHEYILRHNVSDPGRFDELIRFIRANGYQGRFYRMTITYFDADGMTYWDMGTKTPEETVVVNRCRVDESYEARLAAGTLPD